jgi:hypothetical protein
MEALADSAGAGAIRPCLSIFSLFQLFLAQIPKPGQSNKAETEKK